MNNATSIATSPPNLDLSLDDLRRTTKLGFQLDVFLGNVGETGFVNCITLVHCWTKMVILMNFYRIHAPQDPSGDCDFWTLKTANKIDRFHHSKLTVPRSTAGEMCIFLSFLAIFSTPSGRVKAGATKGKRQFEPICIHFILGDLSCFGLHSWWKGMHQQKNVFSPIFSCLFPRHAESNQEIPPPCQRRSRDKGPPWCWHHGGSGHDGGSGGSGWLRCLHLRILDLGIHPKTDKNGEVLAYINHNMR